MDDLFYKKLKEMRESANITQQKMADDLGISLKQYQNYEKKTIPRFKRLQKLNELLKYDFVELVKSIYQEKVPNELQEDWKVEEEEMSYLAQRQMQKLNSGLLQIPLVPVKTQAGYGKRYSNTDFLNELKTYPIPPGVDPHGSIWRFFEVQGDSMLPLLNSGDFVLSSQVPKEDWPEIKDFHVYVIVTEDLVTIKRVFKRNDFKELVLIPENEAFDQKVINNDQIKEIWRYRRHIGWNASSSKKFEIKV